MIGKGELAPLGGDAHPPAKRFKTFLTRACTSLRLFMSSATTRSAGSASRSSWSGLASATLGLPRRCVPPSIPTRGYPPPADDQVIDLGHAGGPDGRRPPWRLDGTFYATTSPQKLQVQDRKYWSAG